MQLFVDMDGVSDFDSYHEKVFGHRAPGDVLIDDWDKYRHIWIERGGRWITHRSASETIHALSVMGI